MSERVYNVLILCTGNSARSILAEAMLGRMGAGKYRAFSAGSFPKGEVNPGAVRLLGRQGVDLGQFSSKSWNAFTGPGAPDIDLVITVCGNAAGEACPVFPGTPLRAHWGLPDPADASGSEEVIDAAFGETWRLLGVEHGAVGATMRWTFEGWRELEDGALRPDRIVVTRGTETLDTIELRDLELSPTLPPEWFAPPLP